MPIYEYTCESCKSTFENLRRTMNDVPAPACPECKSKKTERKLSVFAVASDTIKNSTQESAPTCGRCGGAPGSCGM